MSILQCGCLDESWGHEQDWNDGVRGNRVGVGG